jgi:uncharacterized protein YqeY
MSIVERINNDITAAMKAKATERLSALRMVKTALKLRETEVPGVLNDDEAVKVLGTLMKQRRDAAEAFRAGGREDLALKEEAEAVIIQEYLPAGATEEEMQAAVAEAIAETGASSPKDMGIAMKAARAKLAGKTVDGKVLSDMVKLKLSS